MNAMDRPAITGLAGMTFQASDLDATLQFYVDILGYNDITVPATQGSRRRAYVRINPRQYVEYVDESEPETDRMEQFAFEVDDAEALRLYLASAGVQVPERVVAGPTGGLSFKVTDPDGHVVEFVQYTNDAWPAAEVPPGEWNAVDLRTEGSATTPVSTCMMHIGFTVRSLEKSMAFYRDILGFVEMWRGSADDKMLSWVQMRVPEDHNYIEFMLYDTPPSLKQLGVLNHYGVEVSSVPASVEALAKIPAFAGYPRTVSHNIGVCRHRLTNLFDPDGTRVEPMERGTFDGSVTPSSPAPAPR